MLVRARPQGRQASIGAHYGLHKYRSMGGGLAGVSRATAINNAGEDATCKRTLSGTQDDNRRRLCAWALAGACISCDDPEGKKKHFGIKPRGLPLRSDADLERERVRLYGV